MLNHGMRSVLDQAAARVRAAMSRLALAGGFTVLAVAAALGGIGFLVAVFYLFLAELTSPLGAGLLTGGLLLVLAAFFLFLASRNLRGPRRQPAPAPTATGGAEPDPASAGQASPDEMAARMGATIGADAVQWAKDHPVAGLAAAVAAGFVVGANPDLIRELTKRAKPPE